MSASSQIACINSSHKLHDEWMVYISPRFLTYSPKYPLFIKTQNYTLKTASHISELVELFRMRHHIFSMKQESLMITILIWMISILFVTTWLSVQTLLAKFAEHTECFRVRTLQSFIQKVNLT